MTTPVSPLSDEELKSIVYKVRATLTAQFGKERLNAWLRKDPEIVQAFAYETFLELRKAVHGLSKSCTPAAE